MTRHETCIRDMHQANDGKAWLIEALTRRGHSMADARELADQLSADPASHRTARIALEYRLA